jgi:thioredoxin 1
MIAPVLEELAADFEGRVRIVKHDVQNNPQSAAKFAVRNIPALMLFKDGQIQAQHVGVASKTQLAGILESAL